jgi:hypothetical protein
MKPTHTQPNSPVISIINRSISALIRSRTTWAMKTSISCCATDSSCLLSSINTPIKMMTQPQSDFKEPGWAVGVESEWFRAIFDSLTFCALN